MNWRPWPDSRRNWRIGSFRIRPDAGEISGQGKTSNVSPKAIQVLACLVEAQGAPVNQSEFIEKVWQNNFLVGEHGLRDAIWELRKAFSDQPRNPEYIQTIPRKGYRLLKQPADGQRGRQLAQVAAIVAMAVTFWIAISHDILAPDQAAALRWTDPAPVVSSDGRRIAMVRETNGQVDLFITEGAFSGPDGTFEQLRQLTVEGALRISNSESIELSPAWANRTADLAFMDHDPDSGHCALKLFRAAENKLLTLADDCHVVNAPLGHVPAQLSWSQDDQQIAYQARALDTRYIAVVNTGGSPQSRPVTMPGADFDAFPAWSASGQLAFVRLKDPMMAQGELMVLNEHLREVLHCSAMPLWGLAWADERHVLAATAMNNPFRLWLYDIETGTAMATDRAARHIHSVLNRDQLVVDHFTLSSTLMNTAILRNAPPQQIKVAGNPMAIDYSPARDAFAVVTASGGQQQLILLASNGTQRTLFRAGEIYAPKFSFDGNSIGFTARDSIRQFVRSVALDIESGDLRQLSHEGQLVFFGSWAGQDNSWYGTQGIPAPFGSGATLHRFGPSGEPVEKIADSASINIHTSVHGDLWWSDDSGAIWRRSRLESIPQRLYTLNSRYESWTIEPDSGRLFVSRTRDNGLDVLEVRPGQQAEPELTGSLATPIDPIVGLEMGPGESLVYLPLAFSWQGRDYLPVAELTGQALEGDIVQRHCAVSSHSMANQ
ncbi:MAG: hypothetical protein HKO64_05530 [Xanthomonadales bacterium]|nr:hypothetical protein [Xanthomonadales bacterium]